MAKRIVPKTLGIRVKFEDTGFLTRAEIFIGKGKTTEKTFISGTNVRKALAQFIKNKYLLSPLILSGQYKIGEIRLIYNPHSQTAEWAYYFPYSTSEMEDLLSIKNNEKFFGKLGIAQTVEYIIATRIKKRFPQLKGFRNESLTTSEGRKIQLKNRGYSEREIEQINYRLAKRRLRKKINRHKRKAQKRRLFGRPR